MNECRLAYAYYIVWNDMGDVPGGSTVSSSSTGTHNDSLRSSSEKWSLEGVRGCYYSSLHWENSISGDFDT